MPHKKYLRKHLYDVVKKHKDAAVKRIEAGFKESRAVTKRMMKERFTKGGKAISQWSRLQLYNHIIKHKLKLPNPHKRTRKKKVKYERQPATRYERQPRATPAKVLKYKGKKGRLPPPVKAHKYKKQKFGGFPALPESP